MTKSILRVLTLVVLLGLLTNGVWGCATANVVDTPNIGQGEGLLVVNITPKMCSLCSGMKVALVPRNTDRAAAIFDVGPGDNFRVVSVPAGEYGWRAVISVLHVGTLWTEFQGALTTTVVNGSINYVGDLEFSQDAQNPAASVNIKDCSTNAEQWMKAQYPKLVAANKFTKSLSQGHVGVPVKFGMM